MSSPQNPLEERAPVGEPAPALPPGTIESSGPAISPPLAAHEAAPGTLNENPPWGLAAVVAIAVLTILLTTIGILAVSLLVHVYLAPKTAWIDVAHRPEVIVGSQVLAYLLILALMYRIASLHGGSASAALQWNWPEHWPAFIGYGVAMSITLQLLARFLPMPKTLPIDEFFQTPREAWLLSIFGITFAPLLEELFFRGFLYPVLARHLGMASSVVLTGLAFGTIHGAQLKYSWGPVLVIVVVGIILTVVRAQRKSVASTFLMHVGYNFTLMAAMFAGTDGFRHLDKLRQ